MTILFYREKATSNFCLKSIYLLCNISDPCFSSLFSPFGGLVRV